MQMRSDSYANRSFNQFLRDLFFTLFSKTKAQKNFEVKLILTTRDWTWICPTVLCGHSLICIYLRFKLEFPGGFVGLFFSLNIYKLRCLLLKEMQWEEHNFFFGFLSGLHNRERLWKIQTNLYFWTNCSKPGAYNKLRIIWCKIQFCHPVFTLLIAPYTSVPSFLLVLPVALSRLLKPVNSSKNYWRTQSFLLT